MNCNNWSDGYLNGRKAFFLCLFLGWLGVHRFWCRRKVSGFLYLITFGFYGVGVVVDLFLIAYGRFKFRSCGSRSGFLDFEELYNLHESDDVPIGYKITCWVILSVVVTMLLILTTID